MTYTSWKEFKNLPFKMPTFYYRSVDNSSTRMGKGWALFCLFDYVWIYWTLVVI